jgi:hypothetical protein
LTTNDALTSTESKEGHLKEMLNLSEASDEYDELTSLIVKLELTQK